VIYTFHQNAVSLHTKYKSIHAFDKSKAFILFNMYSFVYLRIVFILISSNDFEPEVIFDYAENARMWKMKE